MSGPQVALACVLRHLGISTAIFGATQMAHLRKNVVASMALPVALIERIERMPDV